MVTSRIGPHHRLFATAEAVTALGLAKGVLVAFYAHLVDFVLFLFIIFYHHYWFWLFQDGTRSSPKTWTTDFSCYWLLGGWTEWIRASNSLDMLSISGFVMVLAGWDFLLQLLGMTCSAQLQVVADGDTLLIFSWPRGRQLETLHLSEIAEAFWLRNSPRV